MLPSLFHFLLLIFSLQLSSAVAHPGISTDTVQKDTGIQMNMTDSQSIEFHIVEFPSWIKETYDPPVWVESWEALEFATDQPEAWLQKCGGFDNDTIVRMYTYSMASGTVINDWPAHVHQRDDILDVLDDFWSTGYLQE